MTTELVGPEDGLVRETSCLTVVCPIYSGQLATAVHCAYKTDGGCGTPFTVRLLIVGSNLD
jgi:hypothetical protein